MEIQYLIQDLDQSANRDTIFSFGLKATTGLEKKHRKNTARQPAKT